MFVIFHYHTGKTEYIYAQVKQSARSAIEVLAEDLPNIISGLSFPKSMRWNSQVMFYSTDRFLTDNLYYNHDNQHDAYQTQY